MSGATFTLSIDFELAWGEFYRREVDRERMQAARRALPRLLDRLAAWRIPATFAVVGHLFLEGCEGHSDHPNPYLPWRRGAWFDGDPNTDEARDPAWYAPSLIEAISKAEPGHDLGAHGFSHLPLDDPGVDESTADAELEASAKLLGQRGLEGFSLVYPRNGIMYTNLLKRHGFACYRGVEPRWYQGAPAAVRKLAHVLDQTLAVTPRVGYPRRQHGVIEAPSSMLFLSREGCRRWLPMQSRVARARRGVERAVKEQAVFHLWFHAEDLVPDQTRMLNALDAVFREVAERRARGQLAVRTMAQLARESVA